MTSRSLSSPLAETGSGQIGMVAAVSIGIGGMVGTGILSILGIVAQAAGNAMWLAFAIGRFIVALFQATAPRGRAPSERVSARLCRGTLIGQHRAQHEENLMPAAGLPFRSILRMLSVGPDARRISPYTKHIQKDDPSRRR